MTDEGDREVYKLDDKEDAFNLLEMIDQNDKHLRTEFKECLQLCCSNDSRTN